MNRMLKAYDWKLKNKAAKATQLVMSSYPGVLFSNDDFYITNTSAVSWLINLPPGWLCRGRDANLWNVQCNADIDAEEPSMLPSF